MNYATFQSYLMTSSYVLEEDLIKIIPRDLLLKSTNQNDFYNPIGQYSLILRDLFDPCDDIFLKRRSGFELRSFKVGIWIR